MHNAFERLHFHSAFCILRSELGFAMRLYLLRHGETDYNVQGLCNDDPAVPVHLNDRGIRQAQAAAEHLKTVSIDRIVVSELPRAQQTADIVNRYHHAPVTVKPQLNDIRTGFNDRPSREHQRFIARDPLHAKAPGGESLMEHRWRVLGILDWLRGRADQTVLLVGHEEPIRALLAWSKGIAPEDMREIQVPNGGIFQFELE